MDEAKTLELLGLTKEQLQERVIDGMVDQLCDRLEPDIDIDIGGAVRKAIDTKVDAVAAEHVIPNVGKLIDAATLQQTNEWGEKKGESMTFIEYIAARANEYLQQPVDFEGDATRNCRNKNHTRIVYLVNKQIRRTIEDATKGALKGINKAFVDGVTKTIKLQLTEAASKLEMAVIGTR